MNLSKLNPWNWLKHEEEGVRHAANLTVAQTDSNASSRSPIARTALGNGRPDTLLRLHREFEQLFDDVWNSFGGSTMFPHTRSEALGGILGDYKANLDVSGDEKSYEIALDVPGLSESDISIDVSGNILTIQGSKEERKEDTSGKQFYRVERSYGAFQRTLSLPDDADANDIQAALKDGVLTLQIPRHEVAERDVKKISITKH